MFTICKGHWILFPDDNYSACNKIIKGEQTQGEKSDIKCRACKAVIARHPEL